MKFPIHIKVHPVIREFYVTVYGSDTIEVRADDNFGLRVRNILELSPATYEKCSLKDPHILTLLLPEQFYMGRKGKHINTQYRGYLDDRRQYFLSKELIQVFKGVFHNYVLAYCRANKWQLGCQKEGIYDFCDSYNLPLNKINYEMLKKSWDRSEEKKKNHPRTKKNEKKV